MLLSTKNVLLTKYHYDIPLSTYLEKHIRENTGSKKQTLVKHKKILVNEYWLIQIS